MKNKAQSGMALYYKRKSASLKATNFKPSIGNN